MLRSEQERELTQVQGLAAAAAYWLVRAGRARDAALALDLGRALQLTERMSRRRTDLGERLLAAAARSRAAVGGCRPAPRQLPTKPHMRAVATASRRRSARSTKLPGAVSDEDHRALADTRGSCTTSAGSPASRTSRHASTTTIFAMPPATDRSRTSVADAEHGFAVVVSAASTEPQLALLEGLTGDGVAERVRQLLDRGSGALEDTVPETLGWLWRHLMEPLATRSRRLRSSRSCPSARSACCRSMPLARSSATTARGVAAPTGSCSATRPTRAFWHARRHRLAPSRTTTCRSSRSPFRMSPELPPLRDAATESRMVGALFGENGRVRQPASPTTDDVLRALDDADIWHFACHGEHDAREPLAQLPALGGRSPDLAGDVRPPGRASAARGAVGLPDGARRPDAARRGRELPQRVAASRRCGGRVDADRRRRPRRDAHRAAVLRRAPQRSAARVCARDSAGVAGPRDQCGDPRRVRCRARAPDLARRPRRRSAASSTSPTTPRCSALRGPA